MSWKIVQRPLLVSSLAVIAVLCILVSGLGIQVLRTCAVLGRLRPETLAVALALSVISALFSGLIWWRLAFRMGYTMPFRAALGAYLNAGLAGYVVNVAGPALGCAASLRKHGVCPGRAVLLSLIANVLGFLGVLIWAPIGLLLLAHTGMDRALPLLGRHGPAAAAALVLASTVAMLVVLRLLASASGSRGRLARLLLDRMPAVESHAPVPLRYRQLLALVPYSAISWIIGALPLYVVLTSISHSSAITLNAVVGSSVLAAALGSLAFFAPEGMGVKDGVLIALLTHATGLPVATCVAAALTMRAFDPATKVGMVFVLALSTRVSVKPANRLANVAKTLFHPALPGAVSVVHAETRRATHSSLTPDLQGTA